MSTIKSVIYRIVCPSEKSTKRCPRELDTYCIVHSRIGESTDAHSQGGKDVETIIQDFSSLYKSLTTLLETTKTQTQIERTALLAKVEKLLTLYRELDTAVDYLNNNIGVEVDNCPEVIALKKELDAFKDSICTNKSTCK